jgi:hypothetical protein
MFEEQYHKKLKDKHIYLKINSHTSHILVSVIARIDGASDLQFLGFFKLFIVKPIQKFHVILN